MQHLFSENPSRGLSAWIGVDPWTGRPIARSERVARFDIAAHTLVRDFGMTPRDAVALLDGDTGATLGQDIQRNMIDGEPFHAALELALVTTLPAHDCGPPRKAPALLGLSSADPRHEYAGFAQ